MCKSYVKQGYQTQVKISRNRVVSASERIAFLVLCFWGIWGGIENTVQAQIGFLPSLDDATVEKYNGVQLISRVHVTRTFVDHEKWFFFKISAEPVEVVDGIDVQILSVESLTNALYGIKAASLSSTKLRHVEFRDLAISLLNEKAPRLRAASARIGANDILELSRVSVSNGGTTVTIPKAALQVSGPDSGSLYWKDAGRQEQLLVLKP